MNNPLYNLFNQNNLIQQFNNFRNSFNGDPEQQVRAMLNSGQISQEQFNKIAQQATQLRKMLPK